MSLTYAYRPVANGIRTDHPHPGLPFVDDSRIPVDDPAAVEAIGRRHGSDTWGRHDDLRRHGGWVAYTTAPERRDLAWVIRWHPDHGRSVLLYRNDDAPGVHIDLRSTILLWRAGGYWWDGDAWYRPAQVWDGAGEDYYERPVPGAATVTAADFLAREGNAAAGRVLDIGDVDPAAAYEGSWADDLAAWCEHRHHDAPGLDTCVVTVTAPELAADALIGAADMARITGIAQSTLRAYISRDEADVPIPQAVIGGRGMWSRPVALEYAEQRERSDDGVTRALSSAGAGERPVPPGEASAVSDLARLFKASLWGRKEIRSRWALRWRTQASAGEVAGVLGTEAAGYMLHRMIPSDALGMTIEHAVLDELASGADRDRSISQRDRGLHVAGDDDTAVPESTMYGIGIGIARMLDWFVRHYPGNARHVIQSVIGEAERRLDIPRSVTERSIATALDLDGELPDEALSDFLRRVVTPR